jgi:heptosyltransferase II
MTAITAIEPSYPANSGTEDFGGVTKLRSVTMIPAAGGRSDGAPRVLVLRLSAMGDVVLSTIFLRALRRRFPQARVDFLVKRLYAPLMAAQPSVDRVLAFDTSVGVQGLLETGHFLRGQRYDLFFDLQKNLRSRPWSLLAHAGHIGRAVKYSLRRRLLTKLGIDLLAGKPDIPHNYVRAGECFGLVDDGGPPELVVPAIARKRLNALVAMQQKPLWGLIPMASSLNKRWMYYGELGRMLVKELGGTCLVIGGPGEEDECARIAAETGAGVSLAGELTPLGIAAALERCRVAFGNDTGPMFIATAVGTPTVAFFGPTARQIGCYPRGDHVRILDRELPCRPCTRNGLDHCPKGLDTACLRDIPPGEALAAARELLES